MTTNLTEVLHSIVPQTTFDCGQFGVFSSEALQGVYQDTMEMSGTIVGSAKPDVPEELLTELRGVLRTLLRKHIVDDRFGSRFEGGYSTIEVEHFASRSVLAAAVLDPVRVSAWICNWVNGKSVPYQRSAVLLGLSIDQPLEMDGGIYFHPLSTSSDVEGQLPRGTFFALAPSRIIGSVKVDIDCEIELSLCRPEEGNIPPDLTWPYGPVTRQTLDDLCEVLSLACNCYVAPVIQWSDYSEEIRMLGLVLGTIYSSREEDAFFWPDTALTNEHLEEVHGLLEKRAAGGLEGSGLDIAVNRWMRSKRQKSYVDKLVELRMALEALYLRGDRSELGFRLSNYGAWHLGANFTERNEYRKVLFRAYREASGAVHATEVKDTEANRKQLSEAQDLCRLGILKRLDETEAPNWNELILGKEL